MVKGVIDIKSKSKRSRRLFPVVLNIYAPITLKNGRSRNTSVFGDSSDVEYNKVKKFLLFHLHTPIKSKITIVEERSKGSSDKGLSNPNETSMVFSKAKKIIMKDELIPEESNKVLVKFVFTFRILKISIPGRKTR